ncbi:hypothetical protein D3C71_1283830 [compost metagenome]
MGRLGAGAGRAFIGVGRQGRVAGGTGGFVGLVLGAVVTPGALLLKTLQQTQGLGVVRQGKAPQRQALARTVQLQRAHTAMVLQLERQAIAQGPAAPGRGARITGQQPFRRHHHPACRKAQRRAQVNLKRCQYVFLGSEHGPQIGPQRARKDTRGVHRMVMLHFWLGFPPPAACGDRSRESANSPRYCMPRCDGILI